MTPEEAGQRILEGNPYIDCPLTSGYTQWYLYNSCRGCKLCKGSLRILDPDYFLACSLLELPLPHRVIWCEVFEEIAVPYFVSLPPKAIRDALGEVASKISFVGTPGPGGNWVKDK